MAGAPRGDRPPERHAQARVPLAQFIDGHPVARLAAVVQATGSPRTAWLWLVEPHPSLEGDIPLDRLKADGAAEAPDLAARDFGQPWHLTPPTSPD